MSLIQILNEQVLNILLSSLINEENSKIYNLPKEHLRSSVWIGNLMACWVIRY